jgi:hypothetical protein
MSKKYLGCGSFRELSEKVHGPANAWHTLVTPIIEAQQAMRGIIDVHYMDLDLDPIREWLKKWDSDAGPEPVVDRAEDK